jgi:pSer/pThr/pTyr-binding forkhead associated (FHA) protein/outer membrane biosynthesis protein TonB
MDVQKDLKELFELLPVGAASGQKGQLVKRRRVLIGSSSACDIHIDHPTINPIHAVIEISSDKFRIFDMDSNIGTYLNGAKIISEEFKLEDSIKFGSIEFQFKNYSADDLPPPLEMLTPVEDLKEKPKLPKSVPTKAVEEISMPRVEYPLGADPKADQTEYIFEDVETLYPIFDYSPAGKSVEVIILHKDRVYSVDYLPVKDGVYNFVGSNAKSNDVEYAYLGKKEKVPFVEVKGNDIFINSLNGYETTCISDSKKNTKAAQLELRNDDIIRFVNGDLQVYVRGTDAPPKVAHAPILRRDKDFMKWLLIVFMACLLFLGFFSLYAVDEEIEKEKVPERIATILYKKRKITVSSTRAVDKTKNKPKKKIQKSPKLKKTKKVALEKKKVKKKTTKKKVVKTGSKSAKSKAPAKKAKANKGKVNKRVDKVARPKKRTGGKSSRSKSTARKRVANSKSKGAVDVFKSADFSSSLNSLMAKGGSVKSAQAVNTLSSSAGDEASLGGSESATLKRAKVSKNVGSLTGASSGKLDSSKGVSGLVNKKSIYTAGVPFEEVVLGGMDPDVIRRILIDNIPQFRYCYQQELDRARAAFNGVVRLDFLIGASGHVTKASVESASKSLPVKVKGCVVRVLKGIKFPEPLGGGVVEVNQPFNFYPKRK